jgi:hypothetical protein
MYNTRLHSWAMRLHKREFDPANKKDRMEYAYFLQYGKWESAVCPFILDWPYLTIPDMIKDKLAHHMLHVDKVWER